MCELYTLELRVHEIKTQLSVLSLMDLIVMQNAEQWLRAIIKKFPTEITTD